MLMPMTSFTKPNPALVRTVRLRRPAAQLLRWASRLNLEPLFECDDGRLSNRLRCTSAGSVCVTRLPALMSSQNRYA